MHIPNDRISVTQPLTKLSIHGGGWTLGDLEGEDLACRSISLHADCVVVSMDYRL